MELAYWKVYEFWYTYGRRLESENGPGTFKYELVQKMGELHADIVNVIDQLSARQELDSVAVDTVRGKIRDIVSLQSMHIIQFGLP